MLAIFYCRMEKFDWLFYTCYEFGRYFNLKNTFGDWRCQLNGGCLLLISIRYSPISSNCSLFKWEDNQMNKWKIRSNAMTWINGNWANSSGVQGGLDLVIGYADHASIYFKLIWYQMQHSCKRFLFAKIKNLHFFFLIRKHNLHIKHNNTFKGSDK